MKEASTLIRLCARSLLRIILRSPPAWNNNSADQSVGTAPPSHEPLSCACLSVSLWLVGVIVSQEVKLRKGLRSDRANIITGWGSKQEILIWMTVDVAGL